MEQVLNVFINGIAGVFIGLGILYIAMKCITLFAGKQETKEK